MINNSQQPFRIGYGYDTHRLKEGRKLILGGIDIPHEKGLDGHSDADVLIHAIIDAMIGALALGDIGSHFPDTDPAYAGADSRKLIRAVNKLIREKGYQVGNVDATVVAERPKLRNLIDTMRANIAEDLLTDISNISVKATTSEKIGFAGREEGISASAVALLVQRSGGSESKPNE
ncbi:MAG: 2-C-methyl-D-erythritol 2,4-cyclodiphosphate synthase [Balneolia bacterium]|nr:2-C-methyl-D-erythritol 2,4-cyclodiphosphate synthase [Balneolia bacterium]